MKVLFITLIDFNSIEEVGLYTDFLREFSENNHDLYIISPFERGNDITKVITSKNTKILKLKIGALQKTNVIIKGINTLTLENKLVNAIKKHFYQVKFDLVVYSTPPITVLKAVEYVKRRDGSKSYLLLKDIFPQNAIDLGLLKKNGFSGLMYNYFRKKEKKLYEISDFIGCMSEANVTYILTHNSDINPQKIEVCPNTATPIDFKVTKDIKKLIRQKHDIPLDKTVFIYGGNLGKPQGVDFLIECLTELKDNQNSYFLIVGSGTEVRKLKIFLEKFRPNNAKLIDHINKSDYDNLVSAADVGLIFLDKRFTIPNFPSRLLSYMQASLPVIAATDVNTDLGKIITDGEFGYWCESRNSKEFKNIVDKLENYELRQNLGKNSRTCFLSNYTAKHSYNIIMNHFKEGDKNV